MPLPLKTPPPLANETVVSPPRHTEDALSPPPILSDTLTDTPLLDALIVSQAKNFDLAPIRKEVKARSSELRGGGGQKGREEGEGRGGREGGGG